MDDKMMAATNKIWPVQTQMVREGFKFQGQSKASLSETADIVKRIVKKHGGTGFTLARDDAEAADLW
jgi:D-lactate dehydrogenase (cytochrome)